ncbi:MAG: serine/threonine-protein kinase [Acidobacteriota bacterium]|nr:serine/threonine-protein kinase [Acidobacteriota bacterium]
MSTDPDTELLRIAEAVSDAEAVNWDEESGAHPALTPALTGLQRVAAVADAFRSASSDACNKDAEKVSVWGRLDVLELIGAGSFGEVYRAHDPLLDREVALKLRKPSVGDEDSSNRRALDEGRRLARVRHPNVLAVHGADVDRGRFGLWTELIDGPNLRDSISEHGVLETTEAITTAIAVCRALNAVHEADLVHGDVKASNVFRDADGRVVLGDFGSASELDSTGVVSGSPVSLSPERLRGAGAEPASDVYSVGVLLYFMLSGRDPVDGTDVKEILEAHELSGPSPLAVPCQDLPVDLTDLVDRVVAADPSRRFATAGELERALEKVSVAGNDPIPATKKSTPPPNKRQIRMWLGVLAVAALAVVVFLVGTAISPPPTQMLVADARLMLDSVDGPIALEDGASIAPGDHLYLEIEAETPVHIYVANEDEAGAIFTLFPVPGLDLENPIPAGHHRLPGTIGGAANDWQVTSAGGAETFLVVAASRPVPEIERRIAEWAVASSDRVVNTNLEDGPTLRGVGGLSTAPGASGGGARLGELQEQLSKIEKGGQTLWSRRIVLNSSRGDES